MSQKPGSLANLVMLILLLALPLAVGGLGGFFTSSSIDTWYVALEKPALVPPNWVFPVVWTSLYALMGIASWLVWRRAGLGVSLLVYLVHLGLNLLWSFLFFGTRNPGAAFIEIWLLLASILLTMALFWRQSRAAGLLFAPYVAWVLFASYLNGSIYLLNS